MCVCVRARACACVCVCVWLARSPVTPSDSSDELTRVGLFGCVVTCELGGGLLGVCVLGEVWGRLCGIVCGFFLA